MKVSHWKFAISSIILTFFFSCQQKREVNPAFYYWKTEFSLSDFEKYYIDSLKVNKLYIKFFDIDWNESRGMPVPIAESTIQQSTIHNFEIVPCIFITNRVFQNISDDKIEWLSARVQEKLFELNSNNLHFKEIQFDCDWTASTKDRFFQFLEIFKKNNPQLKICATIRLHQFRDFQKTGVPPVDRGMLMFYNTGDVESWDEENSILNLEVAKNYLPTSDFRLLTSKKYPIPLDLALPIFRWGVLFRDTRMIRLINNLQAENLEDTSRFLKIDDNRFEVLKSTYLNGYYLYKGDQIRTETVDTQLLLKAINLLDGKMNNRNLTIAFYHLDTATIKYFPHEFLEKTIHQFQ